MKTATRALRSPKISVDHARIGCDPTYRALVRKSLAIAVDRAVATQAVVPTIVAQHEASGACCVRERWDVSLARLTGALASAATPRSVAEEAASS
jgi:hypothetical protein